MDSKEQRSALRGAVYRGDGPAVVHLLRDAGTYDDALQLAGDGVIAAVIQRVDGATEHQPTRIRLAPQPPRAPIAKQRGGHGHQLRCHPNPSDDRASRASIEHLYTTMPDDVADEDARARIVPLGRLAVGDRHISERLAAEAARCGERGLRL